MAVKRTERVGPLIFEKISKVLVRKLEDPRLKGVNFTRVKMTKDLRIARCYYSMIGDQEQIEKAGQAMERARGVFKRAISQNLHLRYMPELEFYYDENPAYADRIGRILEQIHREEGGMPPENEDEPGD